MAPHSPLGLSTGGEEHHPVVVVGAGPVGLCAAIDLAQRGIECLLIDADNHAAAGSRAICFSKRTLEIFDRLGVGERVVRKGVVWSVGKVFLRDRLLYQFDLLAEAGHKHPAFINLQQYYLEQFLAERLQALPSAEVRWRSRVTEVTPRDDVVLVKVRTPNSEYLIACEYLVAADGARSALRSMLGLEAKGQVFRDRFLIADVKMDADFPSERWFWFDPPFHPKQSVLLHRQADNVWRIDFQLGWDADPELERRPERVVPRIQAMLGAAHPFSLEWVSVYTFRCQRMERFRHGRVLFVGDAAHQVSPFGARGANSGIQDADNLAWKLALVLGGPAGPDLLDTYDWERIPAADENIRHSTRSTDFITPKSSVSRVFRDATLQLARHHVFARGLVNSGRLSTPTTYRDSPLSAPDTSAFGGQLYPGSSAPDCPLRGQHGPTWLSEQLRGQFVLVAYDDRPTAWTPMRIEALRELPIPVDTVVVVPANAEAPSHEPGLVVLIDEEGLFAQRYDAAPGSTYLFRPDQHLAARWRRFDVQAVRGALVRAACLQEDALA